MKAFVILFTLCSAALATEEYCFDDVTRACKTTNKLSAGPINCTAQYGAIEGVEEALQTYVNHHFIRSFEFLLMSTHYANFDKNRPGFEKLFRGLSDNAWKDGIELIKYIATRGGEMNFNRVSTDVSSEELAEPNFELYELNSLGKALDIEKKLALEVHRIHGEATRKNSKFHDPEISSHLEHEFMHKQRDVIRQLAGYTADLSHLLDGPDASLALYLFDEYLQKQ